MMQFTTMNIGVALPEIFLAGVSMLLLLIGVFQGNSSTKTLTRLAIFSLLLIFGLLLKLPHHSIPAFNGLFVSDGFIITSKLLIVIGALATLTLMLGVKIEDNNHNSHHAPFELPVLMLLSIIGMMVMVSANNFITLYMGLELQSLPLYVLAASQRDNARSSESGLKYFMLSALASGIMLYGISLIYGFSGTTDFAVLATQTGVLPIGILVGLVLIITALCFKVSAAPFHMWTPDVYQGAPTVITAFFATAPKVAAVILLTRLLMQPFASSIMAWQQIIIFVSAASMIVGALGAIRQTNIKRLMAYSSIGHVGFLLMGLATGTPQGIQAILIYLAIYITMSAGVFGCILMMHRHGEYTEDIASLAGLSKTRPLMAIAILVFMLSMAGIPPLAGFFGKFYIFLAALEAKFYGLAVIGVISSVIAAYYYLRVIKTMYFDEPAQSFEKDPCYSIWFIASIAAIFNIVFFLFPTPLINVAATAAIQIFK